jgi:hypothetical protein
MAPVVATTLALDHAKEGTRLHRDGRHQHNDDRIAPSGVNMTMTTHFAKDMDRSDLQKLVEWRGEEIMRLHGEIERMQTSDEGGRLRWFCLERVTGRVLMQGFGAAPNCMTPDYEMLQTRDVVKKD